MVCRPGEYDRFGECTDCSTLCAPHYGTRLECEERCPGYRPTTTPPPDTNASSVVFIIVGVLCGLVFLIILLKCLCYLRTNGLRQLMSRCTKYKKSTEEVGERKGSSETLSQTSTEQKLLTEEVSRSEGSSEALSQTSAEQKLGVLERRSTDGDSTTGSSDPTDDLAPLQIRTE